MREHKETFLEELRARTAHGLPRYAEDELSGYLRCGVLAHGFARVRCAEWGHELLVGFSCKGRGICPSCTTRRAHDTAAHLEERNATASALPPVGADIPMVGGPLRRRARSAAMLRSHHENHP